MLLSHRLSIHKNICFGDIYTNMIWIIHPLMITMIALFGSGAIHCASFYFVVASGSRDKSRRYRIVRMTSGLLNEASRYA